MRLDGLDIAYIVTFGFIACSALFRVKRAWNSNQQLPYETLPAITAPAMGIGGVASHHPHNAVVHQLAVWTYALVFFLIVCNLAWIEKSRTAERRKHIATEANSKEDPVYND